MDEGDVRLEEITFESFMPDRQFDAIWASHVIEHVPNPGAFLEKIHQILSDDGWLFILVPKFKHNVVGGHISTGWNTGQLMYNLLLSGFDIKNGHFINHGYSVCAFVRKAATPLPELRMDRTDIETTKDLWPMPVHHGFDGDIKSVNWFDDFDLCHSVSNAQIETKKRPIYNDDPETFTCSELSSKSG